MRFDVKAFLEQKGLEFRERGQNVMREHIAMNCPVCGADPSYHLNIKYDGTHALCFVCKYHTKNVLDIMRMLMEEDIDNRIISDILVNFPVDGFEEEKVAELDSDYQRLRFDVIWDAFTKPNAITEYYLERRGVEKKYWENWGFKTGVDVGKYIKFNNMLIMPIHDNEGNVVNFVGRSLFKKIYKNCPSNRAVVPARQCLWGLWESKEILASYVFIVEGIFDAIRLIQNGMPAVALLKKSLTEEQAELFVTTIGLESSKKIYVLLDADANCVDISCLLSKFGQFFSIYKVKIFGAKDAGELADRELEKLKEMIYRR